MLSATQIPKDGVGKEKTIYGSLVRLKAKTLQKDKTTTLKITGMTSGAVKYVKIVVKAGRGALFTQPTTTSPPAGFQPKTDPQLRQRGGREEERGGREEERGGRDERQRSKRR